MMHICFLSHEYPHFGSFHGGVGTFIQTIGRELTKLGHRVSVVGVEKNLYPVKDIDKGVDIYRIPHSNLPKLKWAANAIAINTKLKKIHHKYPIDIVEASELGLAFIQKLKDVKYIIRMHGGHHFFAESESRGINPWKGFQEKLSFKKSDKIIGVSDFVFKLTSKYLSFEDKKGPTIYNPPNMTRFFMADPTKRISGRILFIGTVCEKKGIKQLVQAMPIIKERIIDAHLVIVGRDWISKKKTNSYTEYLKSLMDPQIKKAIRFLGPVPNAKLPQIIEEASISACPSHMEAMPLVWLETLCMGKVTVGSRLGPGSEIIKNKKTGLLCNPLDPNDIAEKIIYLFRHPEQALRMGQAARKDMMERFAIEKIIQENLTFYNAIL